MSSLLSSTKNTRQLVPGSFRYIRSDVPARVTPEDVQWLLTHNIRTVVDLRSSEEMEQTPCPLECCEGFTYFHLPVTGGNSIPPTPEMVHKTYLNMVNTQLDRILSLIENAPNNVLYFCNAGKDRTGVVSALLLLRMGAADADIITDYVLSGENLRQMLEERVAADPNIDIRVITPCEAYMEKFLLEYRKMCKTKQVKGCSDDCPQREI